jgi:hypothetical protein
LVHRPVRPRDRPAGDAAFEKVRSRSSTSGYWQCPDHLLPVLFELENRGRRAFPRARNSLPIFASAHRNRIQMLWSKAVWSSRFQESDYPLPSSHVCPWPHFSARSPPVRRNRFWSGTSNFLG